MKIQAGIFFGGPSRERERSYLSGRTVYELLDRNIFDPVPIFVDSERHLIRLDWVHLFHAGIRDFFPPFEQLPPSPRSFRIYQESLPPLREADLDEMISQVGQRLLPEELPQLINLGILAVWDEPEAWLPQLLTDWRIPFTGSSAEICRRLNDRSLQKALLAQAGLGSEAFFTLNRETWSENQAEAWLQQAAQQFGFPLVVRPAQQRPPLGLSLVDEESGAEAFTESVNRAFFREFISLNQWRHTSEYEKIDHLRLLTDPRDGLGFPIEAIAEGQVEQLRHPEQLFDYLHRQSGMAPHLDTYVALQSAFAGNAVLIEPLLQGRAFSCFVIQDDEGRPFALIPTERRSGEELFEFAEEDNHGLPDHFQPLQLPVQQLNTLRALCLQAFEAVGCQVFGRVDGMLTTAGQIWIEEVIPAPLLLPSAYVFQQLSSVGLNASQALTAIVRLSLAQRLREQPRQAALGALLRILDEQINDQRAGAFRNPKIAILLGGAPQEAQYSLDSGRQVYELLLGSGQYDPVPIWVADQRPVYQLIQLPPALMNMTDAEALRERLEKWEILRIEEEVRQQCSALTQRYGSRDLILEPRPVSLSELREWVEVAFIALVGQPATGKLQADLESLEIRYTGSPAAALRVAADRYRSLEVLRRNGVSVCEQLLLSRADYDPDPETFFEQVERRLQYPLIAKPVDEHSPGAVRMLNNRAELQAYSRLLFRPEGHEGLESRYVLRLRPREAFPRKEAILFQGVVPAAGARRFLEITGTVMTRYSAEAGAQYQVLELSEVLQSRDTLTMEEQHRSGGSRFLSPARLARDSGTQRILERQVKGALEQAARILQLEGAARIDAFVRLYDGPRSETVLFDIHPLPGFTLAGCVLQQYIHQRQTPLQLVDQLIAFAQRREEAGEMTKSVSVAPPAPAPSEAVVWVEPAVPASPEPLKSASEPYSYQPMTGKSSYSFTDGLRAFFRPIWAFVSSPYFLKNLGVWLAFLMLSLLTLNFVLRIYTNHGDSIQVEDYRGMSIDEARRKARNRSFKIVISDSVFMLDRRPNMVLEQDPQPFTRVKQNRRIYLTVTSSTAPKVLLPGLEGAYNYQVYERKLLRLGFRPKIVDREFDARQEENTILYFYHNGEKITEADLRRGIKIPKGSELGFVVTERLTDQVPAPQLVCMRYEEAYFLLTNSGLIIGEVVGEVSDRDNAYVFLQEPEAGAMMRKGEQVTVYLSESRPANCDTPPPPPDSSGLEAPRENEEGNENQ